MPSQMRLRDRSRECPQSKPNAHQTNQPNYSEQSKRANGPPKPGIVQNSVNQGLHLSCPFDKVLEVSRRITGAEASGRSLVTPGRYGRAVR